MPNSKRTYRTGVIGFAHMHVNELIRCFDAHPQVEWVACADTQPAPNSPEVAGTRGANLKRAHEQVGIPKVYDDYRDMLDKEKFDIIIFCPENARCAEVGEAIAAHGAHMLTEKPMTATMSQALRLARAADYAQVKLVTNWPTTWSPAARKAKELIDAGAIGDVLQFKHRNGPSLGPLAKGSKHPGDTIVDGTLSEAELSREWWYHTSEGGGALLDYCCYGACIASWYLGEDATAVVGMAANLQSPFGDAEDNAVLTVRFPKAMAIIEGSWTTANPGVPTGPIIYGSEGTMVITRSGVEIYRDRGIGEPTEVVQGDPLPEGRDDIAKEMIHHIETGEPLHPTLDVPVNLQTMAILDAGIRSTQSGGVELIDHGNWPQVRPGFNG